MRPQRYLAAEVKPFPRSLPQRTRKLVLAHARHFEPEPCLLHRQDHLPRYALAFGKDGAQALMAPHHIAQRCFQRPHIERPLKPKRHRDAVGGAPFPISFQPVEEPQPALRKGKRDVLRADAGRSAGLPACASPKLPANPATVGVSNRARIDSSTSRLARMRLISRVANSE